ncbi:SpoIIE family protein phosphatase [Streptomyces sp. NPDC056178]|uniref:SpoIIE family protein phosphatase n=1 Tax=Streptomyces sp. NPDC056178 TaxID=3345735 RepID=UPI0035E33A96
MGDRFLGDSVEDVEGMVRAALAAAPLPTAVIALEAPAPSRILLASRSLGDLLGRHEEGLVGQRLTDLVELHSGEDDPLRALAGGEDASAVCTVTKWPDDVPLVLELKAARLPGERALAVVQLYDQTEREQAQRSLRENLRCLQDIADYSSALVYAKDLDGRYLLINRQFEQRFGLQREQVRGRTDFDLFPREAAVTYTEHDAEVLAKGGPIEMEEPTTDIAGSWLSIKFPLLDESGRPYAIGGISTDITDRKRAEAAAEEARAEAELVKTALALQHSLLPHGLPEHVAVEVAGRYLPAGNAEPGGDWFDVIPLSGARVALVVGDVVGHGVRASAAMGQLRMAVRTLADVDLAPDELLAHLDDMVIRLSTGSKSEADTPTGDLGATCLYAVYDPVSGRCSVASAGHPSPALVSPDGMVEILEVPTGPPLGVGGFPFESIERVVPEGSVLVLYTDGLIEATDHDVDLGLRTLCTALGDAAPSLETTCDLVLRALLVDLPADDVALLIVRTHTLDAEQVASRPIPADPAVVATARSWATDQLHAWDLDELAFVTELVVSELVTNAIRYAAPPIQLRLIKNQTLICEVSDASSTAPHMRRARILDEGGRGLMLVAQLTASWGTRHTGTGKTIWAEQSLPEEKSRTPTPGRCRRGRRQSATRRPGRGGSKRDRSENET